MVKNIDSKEAYEMITTNKDILVLDVRNLGEYNAGHIKGAKLIPVSELPSRINEIEDFKNKTVIVHCASAGRSPRAVQLLTYSNFTNIYHMKNGLMDWTFGFEK